MMSALWFQIASALGIFFFTFLSEDSATLGAASLFALGKLPLATAFVSCFLGIWAGDVGLYVLARRFGKPVLERVCILRGATSTERLRHSEEWFTKYGVFALIFSRLVPGTRLPTYVTAGLLGMSSVLFVVVTGVLALVWVGVIFWLVSRFGEAARHVFQDWSHPLSWVGWVVLIGGGMIFLRAFFPQILRLPMVQRWRHWEFWPGWFFYIPVVGNYVRLGIKYGGLTIPTAANPGMETGGFIGESKFVTLQQLQEANSAFVARSELITAGPVEVRIQQYRQLIREGIFELPVVFKPDVAQRGCGFRVIHSDAEASDYIKAVRAAIVVQEYVAHPHEIGVFYYRYPGDSRGKIFAITEKIFPVLKGDGVHTLEELVRSHPRACILESIYLRRFAKLRRKVLPDGERIRLVEAGNHAQGCIFRDGMRLWSSALEASVDRISQRVPGFFVGRYDLRFVSEEALVCGEGFKIVELNGASAEATSIYDSQNSLMQAYRTLFKQWELVFSIGAENMRRGTAADSLWRLVTKWLWYRKASRSYPLAD